MSVSLTKRELDLMSVVWELGSATVGDAVDRIPDGPTYSTVLTIFRTLEAKGFVRHEQDGRAFRYYPLIQPDDAGDGALQRLLTKVYRGSHELMIARLLSSGISAEELRRIREQLDRRIGEMEP